MNERISSFSGGCLHAVEFRSALVQPSVEDVGGVGCGTAIIDDVIDHASGSVSVQSGWGCDTSGKILAPKLNCNYNVAEFPFFRSSIQLLFFFTKIFHISMKC